MIGPRCPRCALTARCFLRRRRSLYSGPSPIALGDDQDSRYLAPLALSCCSVGATRARIALAGAGASDLDWPLVWRLGNHWTPSLHDGAREARLLGWRRL